MRDALRHRGPDGEGIYRSPHAVLAHTRLALLDRVGGAQPLTGPDGRLTLAYNGEVYNHPELREELRPFWDFRTRSDGEVVLAAYSVWGRECLRRFNGMFAFVVWDEVLQRGFGARDRLGIKPLFYRLRADAGRADAGRADAGRAEEFLFASEAKAIVGAEPTSPAADVEGILEYLTAPCFSGVSRSMFAGIKPLPAGHCFEIDRDGLRVERWWEYALDPQALDDETQAAPPARPAGAGHTAGPWGG